MDDRRKYRRLRYGIDVELSYYDKNPEGTETINRLRTKDISAGGARITVPNKLDVGDIVSVQLAMPYTGDEIACFALVAWVGPNGNGKFDTGLAFGDLTRQEIMTINRFVEMELDKGIE